MRPDAAIGGAGVGLRACHYRDILAEHPPLPWVEVLADNYFGDGGLPLDYLDEVRCLYPVTLHGVGMSLGSTDPLDHVYLKRLKRLIDRIEPALVSDHLAWISTGGVYLHELLPLPYTEETLAHVAQRIEEAQDFLGRQLLIENPSSYLTFQQADMTEERFLARLVERTGCALLLDVNNLYVSAMNHGWDALAHVQALPKESIHEIHLAGYEERDAYLYDTHGKRVHAPVWELYRATLSAIGPVPTLIEWDTDIPPLGVLMEEAAKAQRFLDEAAH